MDFILADGVVPFSTAIVIMLLFGIIEAASVFAGFSISAALENLLPDLDLPDVDADADGLGEPAGVLAQILGWLSIGRVPALALLVLFLCFFGLGGFAVQMGMLSLVGAMLPASIASIPATAIGLLGMSRVGALIARIIPKDQSQATSRNELLGAVATIVGGSAEAGVPTQAKAMNLQGRWHYVQVEPKEAGVVLAGGERCILVGIKPDTSIYYAQPEASLSLGNH